MQPFFSVIIPIYRVQEYIEQCIESILKQTFQNLECILVDDGSPDNCPELCDRYAVLDKRVKVIHKQNGGLVSARQAGLKLSSGKYIVNVDGDDWIEPVLLERIHTIAERYDPDVISYAFFCDFPEYIKRDEEPLQEGLYGRAAIKSSVFPRLLMGRDMTHIHSNLCGKTIRRELLFDHQMNVDKGISWGEDLLCTIPLYLEAESVYILSDALYHYRQRPASMTKMVTDFADRREALVIKTIEELYADSIPDMEQQLHRYVMAVCFWMLMEMAKAGDRKNLAEFDQYIGDTLFREHIDNAEFDDITFKTRLAMHLIRKGKTRAAYSILRMIEIIKRWKRRMPVKDHYA